MRYTNEMVIEKLKEYPILKKKLHLLSFEMEHMMRVSEDDVLQTMAQALSCRHNATRSGNADLDKVMEVALSYRDRAAALNNEATTAIIQEWNGVYEELSRIDFYMSLLAEEERKILTFCYIEKRSWQELESAFGISRRTIIRRRDLATTRMRDMFLYTWHVNETQ